MDRRLLNAAVSGDATEIVPLALHDPALLLGTTPQGNTCIHIASIHGQEGFCKDVLALSQSLPLLTAVNADGETPLLTSVTRGRPALASVLLRCCKDQHLSEVILMKDRHGCNVLHHAIRRGYRALALELIEAEPDLSKHVNQHLESPMFIAVMRNFTDVFEKLLEISDSDHSGAFGFNVLHAAIRNGNSDIAKRVLETRPGLARQENSSKHTPMHLAAKEDKVDVLKVLLECDPSLGYLVSTDGVPLLCTAASQGHVGVARELLKHCPDAPYIGAEDRTCLHVAVVCGHAKFLDFVLKCPQLQNLINMADRKGETALHLAQAVRSKPMQEMASALLQHQDIDVTVLNNSGSRAVRVVQYDTATTSTPGASAMDWRLLGPATTGDEKTMQQLAAHDQGLLLGATPQGNSCLHIASIHGHEGFCKAAVDLNPSLLAVVNSHGETPLLTAVTRGRVSLASVLLRCCGDHNLSKPILKQDNRGCNALHHAIRSGHRELALELIEAEPALSRAANQDGESPMFIAVMRNYADVFEKLLEIPGSAHGGPRGHNALHAAVRNNNSAIAKKIMETRPDLSTGQSHGKSTPMHHAVLWNRIDVLRVLLEHDRSLGYIDDGTPGVTPLLVSAAYRGHVSVARELLKYCPDAPFCASNGWTCLHEAVRSEQLEFVEFVLSSLPLRKVVNMRDSKGQTPIHLAVQKCNPKMVAALLHHHDIDVTMQNSEGFIATWKLYGTTDHAKTLNWNEVSMLMLKADPQDTTSLLNLHKEAKDKVEDSQRKDIKSLTQTYTGNTSLVAILIATITFAAAFTLPGGYSTDPGNEGLPIRARKYAFQAFLISDTLAMCSSLAVAFICVIAKWEDLEFLLYYRSSTKKLMWFAYMATTMAFATGLYTVLAPHLLWLAITVCVLTSLLPILTKLLGEWPILKLRFRLGRTFKSELLDMV